MCDSGVGEDVAHFLVGYREFERDELMLLDMCVELWRPGSVWMNFGEWMRRALLLGKVVEGIHVTE